MGDLSVTNVRHQNITFNFNLVQAGGDNPLETVQTLDLLRRALAVQDALDRSQGSPRAQEIPMCGCIPPPALPLSGPPAGRGLTTGEQGWPEGTITTAGGYRVVPEGNTNWSIYAPGQKAGETAHTRIWGDPHVIEKDGTAWDFTGTRGLNGEIGNDFVLGDGTRIFARTSSDSGHSVTTGLEIANGSDHISVRGVDGGHPVVSPVMQDGYEWRAQHLASAGDRATFHLRGDSTNVHWVRETRGQMEGVITGSRDANGSYDQTIDPTLVDARLGADMRPPIGSRAWGNALRSELNDRQAEDWGRLTGRFGVWPAVDNAFAIHADHIQAAFRSDLRDFFGGWGSYFPSFNAPLHAVSMLRELLLADSEWQRELQFGRSRQVQWA